MDDRERFNKLESVYREEILGGDLNYWWLSFADKGGFRGVFITKAFGLLDAIRQANLLNQNPHGEVMGFEIPIDHPNGDMLKPELLNRLLQKEDLELAGLI